MDILFVNVATVDASFVCLITMREGAGSNPAGANVVIPFVPPKAYCPLSSEQKPATL